MRFAKLYLINSFSTKEAWNKETKLGLLSVNDHFNLSPFHQRRCWVRGAIYRGVLMKLEGRVAHLGLIYGRTDPLIDWYMANIWIPYHAPGHHTIPAWPPDTIPYHDTGRVCRPDAFYTPPFFLRPTIIILPTISQSQLSALSAEMQRHQLSDVSEQSWQNYSTWFIAILGDAN